MTSSRCTCTIWSGHECPLCGEKGLRLGVFFSAPDTRIAEGIREALRELKEIQLIELPGPYLLPAIDRYRLDAAVGFPETLQSDIGKHRTVS